LPIGHDRLEYSTQSLFRTSPTLKSAMEQAGGYCQQRGVPYAAVTNGHQTIAFIGARSDGLSPYDAPSLVFPSLQFMAARFIELWNTLSKPAIERVRQFAPDCSVRAAAVYLAINALASFAAFALTRLFGWDFGFSGSPQARDWVQCLVAGFGAMVLFRSSLFTVRAGDREIGFGPARENRILRRKVASPQRLNIQGPSQAAASSIGTRLQARPCRRHSAPWFS